MITLEKVDSSYTQVEERSTGEIYSITYQDSENIERGKTSVDSGSFTPGQYRVNPYTVYRTELRTTSGTLKGGFTWYGVTYDYTLMGNFMVHAANLYANTGIPTQLSNLTNEALQKAYGNVARANIGMGENIGEIRETLNMLRHPLKDLREFLAKDGKRNLKRLMSLLNFQKTGSFAGKEGKAAAKVAANTWLELRYGFRPLVTAIGDVIEEVRRKEIGAWDPKKIRCARSHATASATDSSVRQSSLGNFYLRFQGTTEDVMTGYASVQYRQEKPGGTLAELGLTPSFWPETAWELTRLSFVMDWFITIGPWLASLRIKPGVTVLGHTTGMKLVRTITVRPTQARWNRVWSSIEGPTGSFSYTYYHRDVGSGSPWLPQFRAGDVIDLYKVIDLLTLATQRLFR